MDASIWRSVPLIAAPVLELLVAANTQKRMIHGLTRNQGMKIQYAMAAESITTDTAVALMHPPRNEEQDGLHPKP